MLSKRTAALAFLVSANVLGGCPCLRSSINNSESLRWRLFSSYGANRICPEMQNAGVALVVPTIGPASVGRFFPSQCRLHVDEANRTMLVEVMGTGYATLPVTRRVAFSAQFTVEYKPDFYATEDEIYIWGKFTRAPVPPDFRITASENPLVNLATLTPAGTLANTLANTVVSSQLGKGFTVVHTGDGDDFALGILQPPAKPPRMFTAGEDNTVLATGYAEIQPQQRDYLGPFTVTGNGKALTFKATVDKAPLNVTLVDRATGERWRQSYERAEPLGAPPAQPLGMSGLPLGTTQRSYALAPGQYYFAVDNPGAYSLVPMMSASAAYMAYGVELGDRR